MAKLKQCDQCFKDVSEDSYMEGEHPCGKKVIFCSLRCAEIHNIPYMKKACGSCEHIKNLEIVYD